MRAFSFVSFRPQFRTVFRKCVTFDDNRCSNLASRCISSSLTAHDRRLSTGNLQTKSGNLSEEMAKTYLDAVVTLNSLQSNAAVISNIKKERDALRHQNIPSMTNFCARVGISLDELDLLKVIHVSGTKGKGSVCSLCESILRHHGLKTGFYSSPHLIEVRERIRIDGRPLAKEKFSEYFWYVYDRLLVSQPPGENDMPAYFRFLTIMAFHVFLKENVDVAIIEVGLGGEYDCTNVIRKPVVCGISSLGIDHVEVLGDTITKIAWQKAGILKYGCPAVTVPQPEDGLDVIAKRAKEKKSPLTLVPAYESYNWQGSSAVLGLHGPMQRLNASLALQLCSTFLSRHELPIHDRITPVTHKDDFMGVDIAGASLLTVSEQSKKGLECIMWPGRNQVIRKQYVTYYLDGAHTKRSMAQCIDWFKEESQNERNNIQGRVTTVLVFNFTGARQSEELMKPLVALNFDAVAFCPNIPVCAQNSADLMNYMTTSDKQMERCRTNSELWLKYEQDFKPNDRLVPSHIFPSVAMSLGWCTQGKDQSLPVERNTFPPLSCELGCPDHVQVMITGSLHLVGCALRILDPEMNDRNAP